MAGRVLLSLCALLVVVMAGKKDGKKYLVDMDQAAKDAFIDLHNQYRKETGADMEDLVWDETLAKAAKKIAKKCKFHHPKNNPYGENIYLGWAPSFTTAAAEAKKATEKWHAEIVNVDNAWNCIANNPGKTCGHYSQEIWASTTKLGCAIMNNCKVWGNKWSLVFCEYSPKGNMMKGYDYDKQKYIPNNPY